MLETERLKLRRWRPQDLGPFAVMNADAEVMEYYPRCLTELESAAMLERMDAGLEAKGMGLWALELKSTGQLLGYTGLSRPSFKAAFTPCVEVGWRLARCAWGHGYATEAARAAVQDGFARLGLEEIVSFTAAINVRSIRVMERLGMVRDPGQDFWHPSMEPGHRLGPHVLYRLSAIEDAVERARGVDRVNAEYRPQ